MTAGRFRIGPAGASARLPREPDLGSTGGGALQARRIVGPGGSRKRSQPRAAARAARLALGASLAFGAPAAAEEPQPAPDVPIERLFKLPGSVAAPSSEPRRGGKTRAEWQARFEQAHAQLDAARKALDDSRKQLEDVAPDAAWSVTAPGLPVDPQPSEKSIDFRLRQQIRRQREEVEQAERRLDDIGIEANLAEVPDEWRGPAEAPAPEGAPPDPR